MKPRIALDSALVIAGISALLWLGGTSKSMDAQAEDIRALKGENSKLSADLVETQKEIIRKITRIETRLGIQ